MLLLSPSIFLAACTLAWSKRYPSQQGHLRSRHFSEEGLELLSGWEAWTSDQKMKVMYGVFTSPLPKYAEQMAAVAQTWANNVPPQKLLVVGVNGSTPGITYNLAPHCQDGHVSNPGISCKEATLLTTGYKLGADWVVVVGSDNYVFPRNLEQRLELENAEEPQILGIFGCGGGQFCEDHHSGLCGGGGYAISRGALDKMVGKGAGASKAFIQESMRTASTVSGYWSDQVTSCIARRRGVKEVELEGLYGWRLCNAPNEWDCPFIKGNYRSAILTSTPKTLTFHYMTPDMMRIVHQMVTDANASIDSISFVNSDGQVAHDNDVVARWLQTARQLTDDTPFQAGLSLLASSTINSYASQRLAYIKMVNEELAVRRWPVDEPN